MHTKSLMTGLAAVSLLAGGCQDTPQADQMLRVETIHPYCFSRIIPSVDGSHKNRSVSIEQCSKQASSVPHMSATGHWTADNPPAADGAYPTGYTAVKFFSTDPSSFKVEVGYNGGGTLTTMSPIECTVHDGTLYFVKFFEDPAAQERNK